MLTCGKKKKKKRKTRKKKKNPQPVWSALPGCCYLAVYDTQIEGGLVKWTRQPESWSIPVETPSPLAQEALPTFLRDFFCVTWRGAHEWFLNVCLAQASRTGGSNPAEWGQSQRTQTAQCWKWLYSRMQFLKSAKQKSNYYPIMPVDALKEGTLHWLNYHGRCSKPQNGKVCLTCGPWRQM